MSLHGIITFYLFYMHDTSHAILHTPGYPRPDIKWKFGGQVLKGCDFEFDTDGDWYKMTIGDIFPEDAGTYTCFASNKVGETRSTCTILVHGKTNVLIPSTLRFMSVSKV